MTKASKFDLAEMKALFAAPPVLATESAEQFEKVFDQVAVSLNVQDMVELILVRDFAIPSWELDRYTRHRTVAFDRKFKDTLEAQVQQLKTQRARREAYSARLAERLAERPPEVAQLLELESKVLEVDAEVDEILSRTPSELSYNLALERSIAFHKDLEFLITCITKRRNEALEMLDRYRQGLGRRAKEVMDEILDAECKVVEHQIVPPLVPSLDPSMENNYLENHSPGTGKSEPVSAEGSTDNSGESNGSVSAQ
jgi:hypothetical protein